MAQQQQHYGAGRWPHFLGEGADRLGRCGQVQMGGSCAQSLASIVSTHTESGATQAICLPL